MWTDDEEEDIFIRAVKISPGRIKQAITDEIEIQFLRNIGSRRFPG